MKQLSRIISIDYVTHDVIKIIAEKPTGLQYLPGQAVDISINKNKWEEELRAFTFTSLPEEQHIEFTIKTYPAHKGVTEQLLILKKDDELIVHDVFGDIQYKGEGVFIAGGAGITPFIAIMKLLEAKNGIGNNKLIFANKTQADIIQESRFKSLLGSNFINILSDEKLQNYEHGFISEELIRKNIENKNDYFYLCGPDPMMQAVEKQLRSIGIPNALIIKEAF